MVFCSLKPALCAFRGLDLPSPSSVGTRSRTESQLPSVPASPERSRDVFTHVAIPLPSDAYGMDLHCTSTSNLLIYDFVRRVSHIKCVQCAANSNVTFLFSVGSSSRWYCFCMMRTLSRSAPLGSRPALPRAHHQLREPRLDALLSPRPHSQRKRVREGFAVTEIFAAGLRLLLYK